jgi:Flp pilus assembly pilin Flp
MVYLINNALMRVSEVVLSFPARRSDERGQDLIEYALLGGLIAAAILAAVFVATLTTSVGDMAAGIGECIDFDNVDCV